MARGKDRMQTIWGNTPKTYEDYHELLATRVVDAVFIMTPEHLHHDMAIAALRAGKHVYLEKPLAHTIEEGFDIVREWKKSGKIVQVGTQNRSSSLYKKAKELVQQGMIGDVHFVRAFWYRNSCRRRSGLALRDSAEATAAEHRLAQLPGSRAAARLGSHTAISNGASTGIIRAASRPICWCTRPTSLISCWTGRCRGPAWHRAASTVGPGRTTIATCRTPSAPFTNIRASCRSTTGYFGNDNYGYGEQLCGNEGTIEVLNRRICISSPRPTTAQRQGSEIAVKARQPIHLNGPKDFGERDGAINHFRNCVEAIRGNEQVIASPQSASRRLFPATWPRFRIRTRRRSSGTTRPTSTTSSDSNYAIRGEAAKRPSGWGSDVASLPDLPGNATRELSPDYPSLRDSWNGARAVVPDHGSPTQREPRPTSHS